MEGKKCKAGSWSSFLLTALIICVQNLGAYGRIDISSEGSLQKSNIKTYNATTQEGIFKFWDPLTYNSSFTLQCNGNRPCSTNTCTQKDISSKSIIQVEILKGETSFFNSAFSRVFNLKVSYYLPSSTTNPNIINV